MKAKIILTALLSLSTTIVNSQNMNNPNTNTSLAPVEKLELTQNWDKVFPESDKVDHSKVVFVNRYGVTLAADMYKPKGATGKLPAIAVSGPFGAVKEQSSGLYAQQLAERGFLTIAFDPSFTGESGGTPRRVASPDINVEDFSAAVDYLMNREDVDSGKVGILGICGWGGIAIQAAINDPRIKATVASTMYDMTRVNACGYFDSENTAGQRNAKRAAMAAQRTIDFRNGSYMRAGGVVDPLPEDAPQFVKDYYAYYKTPRGYHVRSGNSTDGWNCDLQPAIHQLQILRVCRRTGERSTHCAWRQGPFILLRQGHLRQAKRRQQTDADRKGRVALRPLRPARYNPYGRDRRILCGESQQVGRTDCHAKPYAERDCYKHEITMRVFKNRCY